MRSYVPYSVVVRILVYKGTRKKLSSLVAKLLNVKRPMFLNRYLYRFKYAPANIYATSQCLLQYVYGSQIRYLLTCCNHIEQRNPQSPCIITFSMYITTTTLTSENILPANLCVQNNYSTQKIEMAQEIHRHHYIPCKDNPLE